ncbi:hypothetical protein F5879DRAFT_520054 [Lentinula edodes]|nr:hypothetical protein F5879DRAFT_520054 [Lentinula edodes]
MGATQSPFSTLTVYPVLYVILAVMAIVFRTRSEEIALGMTLLGLFLSSVLYGLALSQLYTYYKRFPRDPLSVKVLVVATAILDTVSVLLECHACWYYLVTTGPMTLAVWSLNAELAVSMFISGIAEAFMTYRVWMLSGRQNVLTCALLCFALLHFTSGEVSAAEFLELSRFAKFGSVKVPSVLRLGSASLCDTGIAVSLCYFLQKKRTGYKRTDEIIDHLMLFSINSGLITSVASIACLITYLAIPKTWVYLTLCFLISRLYSNTFLCALNSRQILQNETNDMDTPVLPRFSRGLSRGTPEKIDVFVVTETITTSDDIRHNISQTSRNSSLNSGVKERLDSSQGISPTLCSEVESGSFSSLSSFSGVSVHEEMKEVPRAVIRG